MHQPLVSIIIPTYNRAYLIGETLESIWSQTYSNWECIVVDDGSNDETETVVNEFCEKDERFQYHKRPSSLLKGANSCRNYGFEISAGEFINWFDSDDIMLDDFLEKKIIAFLPEIQFVISSGFFWDSKNNSKTIVKMEPTDNLYVDFTMWKIKILTPSVLFRKSFLVGKELFKPKMQRGQETELFTRLFFGCNSSDYKIIPEFGFLYRQHEDAKSAKNSIYNRGFKESLFYYLFQNFKRSEQIKSNDLFYYLYRKLIKLFFAANQNQHKELTNAIIRDFFPLLIRHNGIKAFEMILIGRLMGLSKKTPYFFRNRWLKFKFN
ncbi:glycosyltransferase family 2 protein [Flavobacterium lacus]|jgi:glycosyltransferase involved in cell wall biosynthesis|uniref:Glycosyltransferase involved in cell wall biosynthesis n=1 Tax=Flavobacterium lacus TaxID=1353778 RepID=A0A328WJP9_9FLAO|nr:glycosyltransferase family 2 protein [Flavobacterium lacus]RAR46602.1 glycosyltransferase involved in cell wall biosynthesis [Flavobacterium lacus]